MLKEHPELSEHLKKGKEVVDYEVENALLKNALSGNITAQIFWLKNRKPKQWKDKVEVEDESNKETLDKLDEVLKGLGVLFNVFSKAKRIFRQCQQKMECKVWSNKKRKNIFRLLCNT